MAAPFSDPGSVGLQIAVLQRDLAVFDLVEVDAVAIERLAGGIDAGDTEDAEQFVTGAMDARFRVARFAMGLALVREIRAQVVLALEHAAGRRTARVEAPLEIVGDTGRDLLGVGFVDALAEAAVRRPAACSRARTTCARI